MRYANLLHISFFLNELFGIVIRYSIETKKNGGYAYECYVNNGNY